MLSNSECPDYNTKAVTYEKTFFLLLMMVARISKRVSSVIIQNIMIMCFFYIIIMTIIYSLDKCQIIRRYL